MTSLIQRTKGIRHAPPWIIFIFKTNMINFNYLALFNKPLRLFSWTVCDKTAKRVILGVLFRKS